MNPLLHRVARLYSIQAEYHDGLGKARESSPEAILQVLQALGASVATLDDLPNAWRERHQALWQRAVQPVTIAWQNHGFMIRVRLPLELAEARVRYQIALENGGRLAGLCQSAPGIKSVLKEVEGRRYVARNLIIRKVPPPGYHRLRLRVGAMDLESHLIAAPLQAYAPAGAEKRWGIFSPVYALRSEHNWGVGDFADLDELIDFTHQANGHAVATLPLLANFLDEPFNPSPYAPVSRLFWNELYLDVPRIAEFADCPAARTLVDSMEFRRDLETARGQSLIDYRKVMALKRQILEALLQSFLNGNSSRRPSFDKFIATHPRTEDYAIFRAKVERERRVWPHWQSPSRDGVLTPADYDERARLYHLYVQWQCAEQTRAIGAKAKALGTPLYLDFPLGVNRDGYDVWREQQLFALTAAGGAPPDGLFVKGQNWGFPPLQPEAMRQQGYRYYIDCLRHHMASAGMLRVDHVMGLHRAFWIPAGFDATEGMYVRYPAAEFYAIFNLESHRHQTQIIGENLGTVPVYVNDAMARHKIFGMHVGQFGVEANPAQALQPTPHQTVASLNTHDTATFMGFWSGAEIDDRVALGLIDAAQAEREHHYRAAQRDALIAFLRAQGDLSPTTGEPEAVLHAWLVFLARQDEDFLLINLEDLWLESEPQNVPGTWQERPNWLRKERLSLAELRALEPVMTFLQTISDKRNRME